MACGVGNRLVSHVRDITANQLIHRVVSTLCIPYGIIKSIIPVWDKYNKKIAIVAIAKNEGPYLQEWTEFYQTQGVDNIILFDNDSTDDTETVLRPYIESGFVLYQKIHGKLRHLDAYNIAINRYRKIYQYMAFVDCDEFLFCKNTTVYQFVDEIMQKERYASGIGVNWLVFGSSGHKRKPDGGVLENYKYRAIDDFEANKYIKTICNPRCVLAFICSHVPYYKNGYFNVDEDGERIEGVKTVTIKYKYIRINHYFTKSEEEYINKMKRGKGDDLSFRDMNDFIIHDRNEVFDEEIVKHEKSCYI